MNEVQPTKLGVWINVPSELKGSDNVIKAILVGKGEIKDSPDLAYQKINTDGSMSLIEGKNIGGTTTYFQYYSYNPDGTVSGKTLNDWAGKGWTWIEADISSLAMPVGVQRGYTIRITSPQNCQKGKGSILIDNLQMIYGTNTNDINNPVIDSVLEKGSDVNLKTAAGKAKFTTTQPTFDIALNDSKATDKYASGIDASSIKIAIDGHDYTSDAAITQNPTVDNTSVLLQAKKLTSGEHSLGIRVKDTYGNETTETYTFTIEAAEAAKAAVSVTPQGESPVIGKPIPA